MNVKSVKRRKLWIAICLLICMVINMSNLGVMPITTSAKVKTPSLNPSVATLDVGKSITLKTKNLILSGVKKITWTSNNNSIATVSTKGTVNTKKAGKATINCKVVCKNSKKYNLKCNVLVVNRKKVSNNKSILGVWYSNQYFEQGGIYMYSEFHLNEDGTGKMYAYDCLNVSPDDASDSTFGSIDNDEYDGRDVVDFTWQQVGNVFSVVSYQGEPVRFDYKYSKEKGTLVSTSDYMGYSRKEPKIPIGYQYMTRVYDIINMGKLEKSILIDDIKGTWYFDLTTWTFETDGTGNLNIPAVGPGKEVNRKFKYDVNNTMQYNTILLTLEFLDDGTESGFFVKKNPNGSLTFVDSQIKLTRTFDIGNCPMTKEIIENNYKVLSGDIINEWLPKSNKY